MSEKVIKLPISARKIPITHERPFQIELFGRKENRMHSWVLIMPSDFRQDNFLNIVVRNRFDLILDLRPAPVFHRPNYDHKSLMSNLYNSSVRYVDIAKIAQSPSNEFTLFFSEFRKKFRLYDGSEAPFYTLCLTDSSLQAKEIVRQFRKAIREFGDHVVELHPKALLE